MNDLNLDDDHILPDGNDEDLLRQRREDDNNANPPIIALQPRTAPGPATNNSRPVLQIVPPRIGGILLDTQGRSFEAWTGGSNVRSNSMMRDGLCRRPMEYKAYAAVTQACKEGLPAEWRLGAEDENTTMQFTDWLEVLENNIATLGMDTPFHIVFDNEN